MVSELKEIFILGEQVPECSQGQGEQFLICPFRTKKKKKNQFNVIFLPGFESHVWEVTGLMG